MEIREYKRVLVIGNNCFSKTNSNGRTNANLFRGWDKEKLAQFFIVKGIPDYDICSNYYYVSDSDALHAVFGRKAGGVVTLEDRLAKAEQATQPVASRSEKTADMGRRHRKNRLVRIARNFIWNLGFWKTKEFRKWLDDFSPEVIWLVVGDCPFMERIARNVSRRYGIPIVAFTTEDYCFKRYPPKLILHRLYAFMIRRSFQKTIKQTKYLICNSKMLAAKYMESFSLPCSVIYGSTDLPVGPASEKPEMGIPQISYLGNLGVGRYLPLAEIGQALQRISTNYFLDIYGVFPDEYVERYLRKSVGIRYKGFLPYDQVVAVMKSSHILIHTENFFPDFVTNNRYAFSTKIADCLASGTCFFVYASKEIASSAYLIENGCAHVVTEKSRLEPMLRAVLESKSEREKYIPRAFDVAQCDHSSANNSEMVRLILIGLPESSFGVGKNLEM